jgi:predicted transcriptional regulator
MAKDIPANTIYGIVQQNEIEVMEHRKMIRTNLNKQKENTEQEIALLQGQLDSKKEYLAKIEGGLDVLDELDK